MTLSFNDTELNALDGRIIQTDFSTFHRPKAKKNEMKIASIVVTKDSVFAATGFAFGDGSDTDPLSKVSFNSGIEFRGSHVDPERKRHRAVNEKDVALAVRWIFESAPLVTHICISAFGPFGRIGRYNRREEQDKYGLYNSITNYPEWAGHSLFLIVKNAARRLHYEYEVHRKDGLASEEWTGPPEVLVGLDVNIAALGEHYFIADAAYRGDKSLKSLRARAENNRASKPERDKALHKYQSRIEFHLKRARQTSLYVKVSHSVNVGFTSQGWMSRGRSHTQMSAFKPRRSDPGGLLREDDLRKLFQGTCERHGDCIEGLVSFRALEAQLLDRLDPKLDVVDIYNLREVAPENDVIWISSAYYLAQLIHACVSLTTPSRVSLGGSVFRANEDSFEGWEPLVSLTRTLFHEELRGGDFARPVPSYAEVDDDLSEFLRYRHCPAPGLFGGLIAARWDKTGRYPTPVEALLGRSRRRPQTVAD